MAFRELLARPLIDISIVVLILCPNALAQEHSRVPSNRSIAKTMVSDRLFFGRNIPTGGQVSDSAWKVFMAEFVTPAFPEGLTIWSADGQWMDPRGVAVHEPVMIIEVLHPLGTLGDSVFEHIASEYRRRFQQDAVLRTTSPMQSWLYQGPQD